MPLPVSFSAAASGRPPAAPPPQASAGLSLRQLVNAPRPAAVPPAAAARYRPSRAVTLALKCRIDGAAEMITATLKPYDGCRSTLAFQAKELQAMVLALNHDPVIDRLLALAADSKGHLAAFDAAGIQFADLEPDARLIQALQALAATIEQVQAARPDMKLLPGLAGFLHQTECCSHVLAHSLNTRDRISAIVQWLNWQWAAPLEAEERQAAGRPVDVAGMALRYGLCEGGKESGQILSLLWQQYRQRHAALLAGSGAASTATPQGRQ